MEAATRRSICILSTGGTIAMQKTTLGYVPAPGYLEKAFAEIPELHTPDMPHYTITEFPNPIDSANMTPAHWQSIGEFINDNYVKFDGFIILHGTDTMAYTASALSFTLENLSKPVILTGSQLPLYETRNDARGNIINALWIAGHYPIQEVCIYFDNKLFRGNRTSKIDAINFEAFASPNFPVLGNVGTQISIRNDLLRHEVEGKLRFQALKPLSALILTIFPGMPYEVIKSFLQQPIKALILQTYGAGNAPESAEFMSLIDEAIRQEIVIVNCSQCAYAKVRMSDYAAGSGLLRAGVISGADMTVETALAKLFYLFSKNLSIPEIKDKMRLNLRGELTL